MAYNSVLNFRKQAVRIVKETTPGVIAYPTPGSYGITPISLPTMEQQHPKDETPEIQRTSRGVKEICVGQAMAGDWSLECLSRHAGLTGTPIEHSLLEGLLGTETFTSGVSTVYSSALEKPTFSIWMEHDKKVTVASGATVTNYTETLGSECEVRLAFSGKFMKMGWADQSPLAAAITTAAVTVDDARMFRVGTLVAVYEDDGVTVQDDNTGAGFKVLSVNTSTNVVTLEATPSAGAIDDILGGFLPSFQSGGSVVKARAATVTYAGVTAKTTNMTVSITDEVSYLEDEKTASGYPESFVPGKTSVSASMTLYARAGDSKYLFDDANNTDVVVDISTFAGTLERETSLGRCKISSVKFSGQDPTIGVAVEMMSIDTTGLDSVTITYK